MRVMIVEDEPNIVESLSFVFSREGWQVTAALDGDTAIERLLSAPPDILVLDVMLPPHSFVTKPFSNRDIVQQVRDLAASKQGAGGDA